MRGKKLVAMSLFLVLATSLATVNVGLSPESPGTKVKLSPAEKVLDPPGTFTLSVLVENAPPIAAWEFKIGWSFNVLAFPPEIKEGGFLGGPVVYWPGEENETLYWFPTKFEIFYGQAYGYVQVGSALLKQRLVNETWLDPWVVTDHPPSGDGLLATIKFSILEGGDTPINLFDVKLGDYYDASITYTPEFVEGATFRTEVPAASFEIWPKRYVFSHAASLKTWPAYSATWHTSARVSEFESMTPMTEAKCPYDNETMTTADIIQVYAPGLVDKIMTFDASKSYSPAGRSINYTWNFDDGTPIVTTTNPVITHAFTAQRYNAYKVKLTVTDNLGLQWSQTIEHRVWRDLALVDIWPSIVWFDTTDYRFFHGTINKGELIYGPTYKPSGMYYIEILATVVNQGSVTEIVGITMTAKCIETGTEYPLMWFDAAPSPTGRYRFIRPAGDSGWLYDFYWHTEFPSILDAGTYIITSKVTSKTYDPSVAPALDFAGVNYAVPGRDDYTSNDVATLNEIVDAGADLAEHRISPRAFSFEQHGQVTLAGKAKNTEKPGYNVVGTYAKVVFKIVSEEGKPTTIETGSAYLENGQISNELSTTWVPEKEGVYTVEAFVSFGWDNVNFLYTSNTVKAFSFSARQ